MDGPTFKNKKQRGGGGNGKEQSSSSLQSNIEQETIVHPSKS